MSVRTADEAIEAAAGGATVIDVKEPARGPLGVADPATWRAVRAVVPADRRVSVALGELRESAEVPGSAVDLTGIAYRKIGLSGLGDDPRWPERWAALQADSPPGPAWVAVIYADWRAAEAPDPDAVVRAALDASADGSCVGVLVDTWDKSRPSPLDASPAWLDRINRIRDGGLFVALAGSLDAPDFARLAPLRPDLFAVRGAACVGGGRLGRIDRRRVAALVLAAEAIPDQTRASGSGSGTVTLPGVGPDSTDRSTRRR